MDGVSGGDGSLDRSRGKSGNSGGGNANRPRASLTYYGRRALCTGPRPDASQLHYFRSNERDNVLLSETTEACGYLCFAIPYCDRRTNRRYL
ncbi:hypothetical protein Trydic_g11230 [Trypoxylus dichotomus]